MLNEIINQIRWFLIGGVDTRGDKWIGYVDRGDEPIDPWAQGIGVFDMTSSKFKD